MTLSSRPCRLPALVLPCLLTLLGLSLLPAAATAGSPSARAAAAGPKTENCAKSKRPAVCRKQNQDNRLAFNLIKDRTFTGERGDGASVVWTFCANGKFESRISDSSSGTGLSTEKSWTVRATVKNGGKSITAFIKSPGGSEVALLRQAGQWKVAVASLDRALYPGPATRTPAGAACT